MKPDVVLATEPVADAFNELGIAWLIGGSVASSAQGVARATLDVDLVAELSASHVDPLRLRLEAEYYLSAEAMLDAVRRQASFNMVHFATMVKVDVFVNKFDAYSQECFRRRRQDTLETAADARKFWLSSPEDTILQKLRWFRLGGAVSERQWNDILGVMKVQRSALDLSYLRQWASFIGVTDLLDRASAEAKVFLDD